ncbi:4Fe-4S binding protein [Draconibacterium sp.]|nr:4Fe-4S binding protein [Draconibacterium sp.]
MEFLKPKYVRLVSTVLAVLLALPLQWKWLTGIYSWLSPFIMLNSVFLLKSFVLLNLLGGLILLVSFFKNRWFCRYLCPVGEGCDRISKVSKRSPSYLKRIPPFGRWLVLLSLAAAITGIPLFILLDPMAIFNGFFSALSEETNLVVILSFLGLPIVLGAHFIYPGIWCAKICPLGGMFDELTRLRKFGLQFINKKQLAVDSRKSNRRLFIASGTGLLAGLLIPRIFQSEKVQFIRPPASLPDRLFNTLCVRCGNCIKACPTNIITHYSGKESLTAWMTPEVTFKNGGYCKQDCNLCGTVCPSGSISPFTIPAKQTLFMASVEIGLDKCLLTQQTECDRCKAVCSYSAIEIVQTDSFLIMKPVVDFLKCVGCGACAVVCPADTIKMLPLANV